MMQNTNKNACRNILLTKNTFPGRNIGFAFHQIGFLFSDMKAIYKKDPALNGKFLGFLEVILYAGFWALLFHRIAFLLNSMKIPFIPRLISQVARFLTGIEIHPGARIGRGVFIDHGNGVVIGETSEIGNDVVIFHQVTLGAKGGYSFGKRHPTIGDDVVLGAGAKIIGDITIGNGSIVGAGSVVLRNIGENIIVVGNPAREISKSRDIQPEKFANKFH
jgi:serine O-acetyltransferase